MYGTPSRFGMDYLEENRLFQDSGNFESHNQSE